MGDITRRITRKSLKAKRKAAIKTIKAQAKEKIHQIKVDYSMDAEKHFLLPLSTFKMIM